MKISAVLFDLNGTILDDEGNYTIAFNSVLKGLGVETSKPIPHENGIGVKGNWEIYLKKFSIKTDKTIEMLVKETQNEYLKLLDGVATRTGFEKFVERLKSSDVKIGLATSNTWEVTTAILEKVELLDVFDSITTEEEVKYNKPDPELFLVAADKLGVESSECLVIEDSVSGVEAAHRAGMKVVAIASEKTAPKLAKADLVVESFSELTPQVIDRL